MNIIITKKAFDWYKRELELKPGDAIRFFARYGGCSTVQKGFSLGMTKDEPAGEPAAQTTVDGVTFFVEDSDQWYFDGRDLTVDLDEKSGEPVFLLH
ncbi:HesB/YadR/YfhF family protein [Geobacillus stearothermophilus]|uniref:HesB/YadR/YfhF family protein n=1 Tax=Geobacillus stearothermophilus TaxID=1422 RepID=UPI001F163FFC|nr:HesB/YadR/YfhF family protein [Geobacillus stearothermophilus]MCK7606230.1 HesB/YadR/YfhF family protein [Geobacillus stearothermophilus]